MSVSTHLGWVVGVVVVRLRGAACACQECKRGIPRTPLKKTISQQLEGFEISRAGGCGDEFCVGAEAELRGGAVGGELHELSRPLLDGDDGDARGCRVHGLPPRGMLPTKED